LLSRAAKKLTDQISIISDHPDSHHYALPDHAIMTPTVFFIPISDSQPFGLLSLPTHLTVTDSLSSFCQDPHQTGGPLSKEKTPSANMPPAFSTPLESLSSLLPEANQREKNTDCVHKLLASTKSSLNYCGVSLSLHFIRLIYIRLSSSEKQPSAIPHPVNPGPVH
jgi:hypothetical protein